MQNKHLIDLEEAAVAIQRPSGKVKLHRMHNLTASGASAALLIFAAIGVCMIAGMYITTIVAELVLSKRRLCLRKEVSV
ncbi:MAG: hypothetical protein ACYTEQ_08865 [Planctomycetota bacterium]|jgi:uncharacterized membrane protein